MNLRECFIIVFQGYDTNMTNWIFYKINMTVERLNEISIFQSLNVHREAIQPFGFNNLAVTNLRLSSKKQIKQFLCH